MLSLIEKSGISMTILLTVLSIFMTACGTYTLSKNDRIVFFGDSITELGVKPNGYISLLRQKFDQNDKTKNVETIGAGISGHKVPDLLARVQRDVLSKNPTIVFLYIGINDVWHSVLPGHFGTPPDEYKAGLISLVNQMKTSGIRVILCTPTTIGEKTDGTNPLDSKLDEYAAIVRCVAQAERVELCDLRTIFMNFLKQNNPQNVEQGILTYDGVHLTDHGNQLVADSMLQTWRH